MMNRKIAKDSLYNICNIIFNKSSFLFYSFYCVNLLGISEFGIISYVNTTILFVQSIVTLGMSVAVTREVSTSIKQKGNATYASSLAIYFLLLSYFTFLALLIIYHLYSDEKFDSSTFTLAIGAFFASLYLILKSIINGLDDFKTPVVASLYSSIVSLISLFILTYCWGENGALIGIVLLYFFSSVFLFYSKKSFFLNIFNKLRNVYLKDLICFFNSGLPHFLAAIFFGAGFWFSMYLLKISDTVELGVHNAINQFFMICSFIPIMVSQAMLPKIINGNMDTGHKSVLKWSMYLVIFSLLIFIFIYLISDHISNFYGYVNKEYFSAVMFFCLLSACLVSSQIVIDNINVAGDGVWRHCTFNLIWLISLCLFLFYFKDSLTALNIMKAKFYSYLIRAITLYLFYFTRHFNVKKII